MARFDKDGDGRLNREERQAAREFLSRAPGPGGPGDPGGPRDPADRFLRPVIDFFDVDRNGQLHWDEVSVGVRKLFGRLDAGGKGSVDASAIASQVAAVMPGRKGGPPDLPGGPPDAPPGLPPFGPPPDGFFPGGPPGGGPPPPPPDDPFAGHLDGGPPMGAPGGGGPAAHVAAEIVRCADSDHDGRLSRDELLRHAETVFRRSDRDGSGRLDREEILAAVDTCVPGPHPGHEKRELARPGAKLTPADVKVGPAVPLYDPGIVRTLFLEFEDPDWEAELADFHKTDVEVPATLTVDGKRYPQVGVHFRGMTSFMTVPTGYKRSLGLSLDFVDPDQRLLGYKTLNLLNSHEDPTFLHTVLFSEIARTYIPAPKANFVRVVINGESWGLYVNVQQFNKEFVAENYASSKGARWKAAGGPGARAGLEYLGDDPAAYKRRYEIKSKDRDKDWKALIELCRVLGTTSIDRLEEALEPILDLDGVLWFLALDTVLINGDGYWTRGGDYSLYRDEGGRFHVIPYDVNETFQGMMAGPGGGPGPRGGPGPGRDLRRPGSRFELDPLVGLSDSSKPLRSRLLAVPRLKARYLDHVGTIARDWLDWTKLGPVVARYRALVEREIEADTRKLSSLDEFRRTTAGEPPDEPGGPVPSLRSFAEKRRAYLLGRPEVSR